MVSSMMDVTRVVFACSISGAVECLNRSSKDRPPAICTIRRVGIIDWKLIKINCEAEPQKTHDHANHCYIGQRLGESVSFSSRRQSEGLTLYEFDWGKTTTTRTQAE